MLNDTPSQRVADEADIAPPVAPRAMPKQILERRRGALLRSWLLGSPVRDA